MSCCLIVVLVLNKTSRTTTIIIILYTTCYHKSIMSRSGMEKRFADRFHQRSRSTQEDIESIDAAKSVADQLTTARAVISTQEENVNELFSTCVELVKEVDIFQQQSGQRQVNNIPLPSTKIMSSFSLKLGYIKLSLQFFGAGMEHFMEENLDMSHELKMTKNTLSSISEYSGDVTLIGKLEEINFNEDQAESPIIDTRTELMNDDDDMDPQTKANLSILVDGIKSRDEDKKKKSKSSSPKSKK
jgi:hypothetical protein